MTKKPVEEKTIQVTAADVDREARWLSEAGHDYPASLLRALWSDLVAMRRVALADDEYDDGR